MVTCPFLIEVFIPDVAFWEKKKIVVKIKKENFVPATF